MHPEDRGKVRVFLVDDHPIVREGVRAYLSHQPSIVVVGEACDGREALDMVPGLHPDVVVMDVSLPSLDGGELARRLRRAVPNARLLAFSIHAGEEYVVRMARCGARGYVMKDEPPSKLLAAIEAVARGELSFPSDMTDAVLSGEASQPASAKGRPRLTAREKEVLSLVADGLSNKQIAGRLGLSIRTIESHRERLSRKLRIRTVAGLTKYAIQEGFTALR